MSDESKSKQTSGTTESDDDSRELRSTLREVIDEYKRLLAERLTTYDDHIEKLRKQNDDVENHLHGLLKQKDEHIATLMRHLQDVQFTGSLPEPPDLTDSGIVLQENETGVNEEAGVQEPVPEPSKTLLNKEPDDEFQVPETFGDSDNSIFFQQKLIRELRLLRNDLPGLFLNFFMNLADFNLYVEVDPTHWKSFDIDEKKDTAAMVQEIYEQLAVVCGINLEECEIRFMDPPGETLARYWKKQMSIIDS
jgi:hypothetical protein